MQSGILSGRSILRAIQEGDIKITPFDAKDPECLKRLNPASYDLTLGREIAVYTDTTVPNFSPDPYYEEFDGTDLKNLVTGLPGWKVRPKEDAAAKFSLLKRGCLDAAKENEVARFTMQDEGFVLMPGVGYLMHTQERISTDRYVPIIDGKSSIGRLFCFVHVTAGYGDPGFDGQYTLEVAVLQPLVVYPGMRFCQIRFHTIVGEVDSYKEKGNYKGELAEGPVPSRSWKMFDGHKA
jgi:dCTP deaminase